MADIRKTSSAKIYERDVRSQLDQLEADMLKRIQHGNIYEEFVKSIKFKLSDYQDYFGKQWLEWKGRIIQDEEMKSQYSSFRPPSVDDIPVLNKAFVLNEKDRSIFLEGMRDGLDREVAKSKGVKFDKLDVEVEGEEDAGAAAEESAGTKVAAKAGTGAASDEPMTYDELQEMAGGTLDEWDTFVGDTWNQILDSQMMSNYKTKMAEIKEDVDRLIALAKSGAIAPEFVLIALAKVNTTKNGVLVSWLGQKAFHANESMNKIATDLHAMDPSSPNYGAEMQMASSKTRDGSFQLNLVLQDMQKCMTDTASVMEQVNGMMAEMNRTRREIVSRIGGR